MKAVRWALAALAGGGFDHGRVQRRWRRRLPDGGRRERRTPAGGSGGGRSTVTPVTVSTATRTPRTTTWSVNYWLWMPAFGDDVTGTETLMAALTPTLLRVGGYNNDANTPDPFDDAALDTAVAYARAIGAEPIIQVPLLADTSGNAADGRHRRGDGHLRQRHQGLRPQVLLDRQRARPLRLAGAGGRPDAAGDPRLHAGRLLRDRSPPTSPR